MIRFILFLFLFTFLFDHYHSKKLELLGSTRNSVIVKVDNDVFTFNFGNDFLIPKNVTIYKDDKHEVRNNAGRVVYVDRENYISKMMFGKEKNKTLYSESVPSIVELKSTIIYVLVSLIIILLLIISFFSYQFSNAKKILKKLREDNSKSKNVFSKSLATLQNSIISPSLVSGSFKDKYISDIKTVNEKSYSIENEKIVKLLIMSKTGELIIKTKTIKNFKNTDLTPKTLSSIVNSLGFMAMLGVNNEKILAKESTTSNSLERRSY